MTTESIQSLAKQQTASAVAIAATISTVSPGLGTTARAQFAVMDLFKMLFAAALSGLVFSAIAAGLTLVLMTQADARGTTKSISGTATAEDTTTRTALLTVMPEASPSAALQPGVLAVGDGCERAPLEALDRDWRIRIYAGMDHDIAEIRVMQSYAIPEVADETETDESRRANNNKSGIVASFHALLPAGAVLSSFRVDATESAAPQTAKLMTYQAFAAMHQAATRALRKSRRLIVLTDDRRVESDSILNLRSGETVTVEYIYAVPIEKIGSTDSFSLNLILQTETPESSSPSTATTGTVWVEWVNSHPTQAESNATDISIERVTDGVNGVKVGEVVGASWYSPDLSANRQFSLKWDRSQPVASANGANGANAISSRVIAASR